MSTFASVSIICLECDHAHDVVIVRGEYPSDDYADGPESCESCGADLDGSNIPSEASCRASERRQMGIL